MTARAAVFAVLGVTSGFLLARIVPDTWWITVLTVAVLVGAALYIRSRRRSS